MVERHNGPRTRWRLGALATLLVLVFGLGLSLPPRPTWAMADTASAEAKAGCAPTPGFIGLDGRSDLEIRRAPGAQKIDDYVGRSNVRLQQLAEDRSFEPDQIVVQEQPPFSLVGILKSDGRFTPELGVDDPAGACFGLSRQQLALRYRDDLRRAISTYRGTHTSSAWLKGTALAALVLAVYILWLRLQGRLNRRLRRHFAERSHFVMQGLGRLGVAGFVEADQVRQLMQWLRQLVHWTLVLVVSYLLIPLLLGFFPPTAGIAEGLRGQIRTTLLGVLRSGVQAIPNLLSIVVVLVITGLVIRASQAWFRAIHHGRIRLPGFYQEWALPTSRLVTILFSLFGLAAAFPYIPGSSSKVFQGAGLFLGALAAIGSSAVTTNIISGLMLIYTRAFREGDRVEINGVVGVVQDRALLVTRLQTPRNELVSIPNASVIGASVVNYSFSRREIRQPVAIATTITIGYDVPWRRVHALMLAAAGSVAGLTDEVAPFVLQTSLNDFHISYELTAFVRAPDTYRQTLSDVLAALQDQFAAADVEILSPGYHAIRNGNASTVPKTNDKNA
ncbi:MULTISPECIES: mechanosensitive ion channel family protein [unclassified Cyanobium]|uniref:mechanosensitive ion channel family protein n=1 Tax=unclassified Cyanobium TaxID=2627006 RepID=UPI0020CCA067|nr:MULTISPECIES: mechanosensitive ion channel domain-containing protein [unclassified Cyanobium]